MNERLQIIRASLVGRARIRGARTDEPQYYLPSEGVRASTHADGFVLLNIDNGRVLKGNRTAKRAWEALTNGCSIDETALQISQEYGIEGKEAQRDIRAFVFDLLHRRLIEPGTGPV